MCSDLSIHFCFIVFPHSSFPLYYSNFVHTTLHLYIDMLQSKEWKELTAAPVDAHTFDDLGEHPRENRLCQCRQRCRSFLLFYFCCYCCCCIAAAILLLLLLLLYCCVMECCCRLVEIMMYELIYFAKSKWKCEEMYTPWCQPSKASFDWWIDGLMVFLAGADRPPGILEFDPFYLPLFSNNLPHQISKLVQSNLVCKSSKMRIKGAKSLKASVRKFSTSLFFWIGRLARFQHNTLPSLYLFWLWTPKSNSNDQQLACIDIQHTSSSSNSSSNIALYKVIGKMSDDESSTGSVEENVVEEVTDLSNS